MTNTTTAKKNETVELSPLQERLAAVMFYARKLIDNGRFSSSEAFELMALDIIGILDGVWPVSSVEQFVDIVNHGPNDIR